MDALFDAMARGAKRQRTAVPPGPEDGDVSSLPDTDSEVSGADQTSSGEDNSGSGSDDAEDDDEGDTSDGAETVDVDLEFFDPAEGDFHGLKALLKTYLDGNDFKGCSELVEAIIKQRTVGTVVKTSEADDPIGIITVLNLQRFSTAGYLQEIRDFLRKHCKDAGLKAKLEKVWDQKGTGLVVSERLLNSPPQLAPPLQQALFDEEIPWATEDEPSQALRDSFAFERFLFVSRIYVDSVPSTSGKQAAPERRAKKRTGQKGQTVTVYARPEDEFYHKHCSWSYTFPVSGKIVQKDELQPLRLVMLLSPDQAAAARKELNTVVGNVAMGLKAAA